VLFLQENISFNRILLIGGDKIMTETNKFWKRVYCRSCNNKNNHSIIFKHSLEGNEGYGFFWSEDYIIGQCMGCETVCFIKQYDDSSMHFQVYDENGQRGEFIEIDDVTVYPQEPIINKDKETYVMISFNHIPEFLNTLYKQVVANFELKYYLLAAAGMRMIIEGICNHLSIKNGYLIDDTTGEFKTDDKGNKIKSSSLNGKINGLAEIGVLTSSQTAILHIIRKLGNQTVHNLSNPKRKIMLSSLEIIEQTFQNIFELKKYDSIAKSFKN
jgi:hypothetical protein